MIKDRCNLVSTSFLVPNQSFQVDMIPSIVPLTFPLTFPLIIP